MLPCQRLTNRNINELKEAIAALRPREAERQLLGDLIKPCDIVVLVTPIDSAAPKGRLILPQQQVLRNVLDNKGIAVTVQESELAEALARLAFPPKLVVTDSQAFGAVSKLCRPPFRSPPSPSSWRATRARSVLP